MPTFDRTIPFDAPPDALRLVFPFVLYPALIVEQPEQGRAIARIEDFLHIFQWTSSGDQTSLRYWIRHDQPGALDQLAADPSVYEAAPADLTELEMADAEARLNRLKAAVADVNPKSVRPPVPSPAPFGMDALFLWTLILSVGGVFVAAMNWRRLGRPKRFWSTLVFGTALYVGGAFALVRALDGAFFAPILALIPYAALAGGLLVRWQHAAYTRWVETYGKPTAAAQRFGVDTVVVLGLASALVALPFLALAGGVTSLWGGGHVTVAGISLSYPPGWSRLDAAQQQQYGCEDGFLTECVLVLGRSDSSAIFFIQRQRQLTPSANPALASAAAMIGLNLVLGKSGFEFSDPVALKVGDRPALRHSGAAKSSSSTLELLFIQESPYSSVMIYGISIRDYTGSVRREIDGIIGSLRFEES